jgi:peptide chain release factor 2
VPFWCNFDLPSKEEKLANLEKQSESESIWDAPRKAQILMKNISSLRNEINEWHEIELRISDAEEYISLNDESLFDDLSSEINEIVTIVGSLELKTLLNGKFDNANAILTINAGAGGTDSQDWSEMLQRMYLRWADKRGFKANILEQTQGDEAGIKTTTISIDGEFAYGYLRSENGVHRLVRLSPFDSNNRRHTSFTQVEILPVVQDGEEITINPKDLKIETFRAGGAGGQSVQKNDTAVRLTHIPSGLVASCQNQRSQTQNREFALKVLLGRLIDLQQKKDHEEKAKMRGNYVKAEWGSQIRSYVLHPYQMVKDHRTSHEVGNAQLVLDGGLDGFIESFLRQQVF